jgi:nucleotide-binding universal stress UspA family protein
MYTNLLIPLDGSEAAETVLPFARLLAGALKIPIRLLVVVDVSVMTAHIAADKARYLDELIAGGERTSRAYLKELSASLNGFSVEDSVERGDPAEVIIEKAAQEKGTLVAMATHGRSGFDRWLLGSVAEKVLRGTSNDLFLVRANEKSSVKDKISLKSVIVPLDGSELAERVLPSVVEMAKVLDLEVKLFRAYELAASAYYGREDHLPDYQQLKAKGRADAQSYLEDQVEALKRNGLSKVTSILTDGTGADEIITCAREHPESLVAMCTHGRSGVTRWVLGSVTEKVVRHAGNPMLIAHGS